MNKPYYDMSVEERMHLASLDLTHLAVCPQAVLMFSLYDTKSKQFGAPSLATSSHILTASVMGLIKEQPSNPLALRPRDFDVWEVGVWSPLNGAVFALEGKPRRVGNLVDLIEAVTPNDLKSMFESIDRLYNSIMADKSEAATA